MQGHRNRKTSAWSEHPNKDPLLSASMLDVYLGVSLFSFLQCIDDKRPHQESKNNALMSQIKIYANI